MMLLKFLLLSIILCHGTRSDETEHIPNTDGITEELAGNEVDKVEEALDPNTDNTETKSSVSDDLTLLELQETKEPEHTDNSTLVPKNTTNVFFNCSRTQDIKPEVELVNSTQLLSLLVVNPNVTRAISAECLGVYFFARWCPFSTMAAPHINALPRAFPFIRIVAVDAMKYHMFNTQYGVVGVPTFILFHNGRPAVKFNETEYTLERFSSFISKFTTIPAVEKISVTSADFNGPVPSVVVREPDYFLWLSWAFLAVSAVVFFTKSSWYRKIVEAVKVTWRESEAQHDHMD